jgi:hypothetical protein
MITIWLTKRIKAREVNVFLEFDVGMQAPQECLDF